MPEPIFHAPGGDRGTALQQLRALREMARGGQGPGAMPAIASGGLAAQPDAAVAGLADDAAAATRFVDDAAAHAAVLGHDPEALARAAQAAATRGVADPQFTGAAQQVLDVRVEPRLIVQGQQGPLVVPVDVAVPAAQPRVTIGTPTAVVVDPLTGQAVTQPAALADDALPTARRAAFRSMGAQEIGDLLRRGGAAAHAADGAVPVTADAAAGARPTLLDQLRGAAGELRRPLAAEVAEDAQRVAGRGASVLDELRGGIGALRGSGEAAREVVEEAVEHAPSLANRALEALRLAARVNPRG